MSITNRHAFDTVTHCHRTWCTSDLLGSVLEIELILKFILLVRATDLQLTALQRMESSRELRLA